MTVADSYLTVLAQALTRYQQGQDFKPITADGRGPIVRSLVRGTSRMLDRGGVVLTRRAESDDAVREEGRAWPEDGAETMVGLKRLANIRYCIETALADGVPGDVMECGVWRGGSAIYMAATLAIHGASDRNVWVVDSFEGMPAPETERYAKPDVIDLSAEDHLAVGLEVVKANFEKYHLLEDNVRFLKGWFSDTLPSAPVTQLSVLRLDGDLYSSTMDVLTTMYDKVSPGGFVIVDDFHNLPECREAVEDFRAERGITDPIIDIDWTGAYWRRT